jgi:1-acyl-sn-glycerol-3-phosphate acyltransferase
MAEPRDDGPGAGARDKGALTRLERTGLAIGRLLNEGPRGKHLQYLWNEHVGRRWVRHVIGPRVYVDNIEWLIDRPTDRGVMLALNHRSFFDAYLTTFALYQAGAHRWAKRIFFPVRSNFFYERPLGVTLNLMLGAGVLYPPIFRDPAKASYTKDSVERLIRFLGEPDTLVGIHPEGTRKIDDDPYTMLPAQPGVGQMALKGRPLVVPAFINGLGNNALEDIGATFTPGVRQRRPVIIVFGQALDYEDLKAQRPRAALYKQMADRMRDAILALGPREKELRAACARGELPDGAPGWLTDTAPRH